MNVRSLIRLLSCEVDTSTPVNYDNPYTKRINITYGPPEMPFHDNLHLTVEELVALKEGLIKILGAIDEFQPSDENE